MGNPGDAGQIENKPWDSCQRAWKGARLHKVQAKMLPTGGAGRKENRADQALG